MDKTVIEGLSALILNTACSLEQERNFPGPDADRMDDRIKFYGERLKMLREIRQRFEDEISKVAP